MTVDLRDTLLVVPFRFDSAARLENLSAVLRFLGARTAGADIVVVESGPVAVAREVAAGARARYAFQHAPASAPFHRTRLINREFESTDRPLVGSYDADVLVEPAGLGIATARLRADARVAFPYCGTFLDVSGDARWRLLERPDPALARPPSLPTRRGDVAPGVRCVDLGSVGGAVLFHRETLLDCGGYDEGFVSWGWEDREVVHRLALLGHPVARAEGLALYHLAHPRSRDSGVRNPFQAGNRRRYRQALREDAPTVRARIAAGDLRRDAPPPRGLRPAVEALRVRLRDLGRTAARPRAFPSASGRLRLCFVVHRYAPAQGGSEVYVRSLAEESAARGHEVVVLTAPGAAGSAGVAVTADAGALHERFDLVVVHGAFRGAPATALAAAERLPSPVLYLVISHALAGIDRRGARAAARLGWSTPADLERIAALGHLEKAVPVRHGLAPAEAIGAAGFRARHGVPQTARMILSSGGYWPNKRMRELAALFARLPGEAVLVTTGYDDRSRLAPAPGPRVLPLMLADRAEVLSAIREADCYVMHSRDEGFGLVLLEAMLNRTPWIAHATGAAPQLAAFGRVYESDRELERLLAEPERDEARLDAARRYALERHDIARAVDDIERVAAELGR